MSSDFKQAKGQENKQLVASTTKTEKKNNSKNKSKN